jgi:gluconolactonase
MLSRWQRLRMRADFTLRQETPICSHGSTNALRDVLASDALLERVVTNLQFTEGPVWHAREQRLLFSDIPGDCIHEIRPDGSCSRRHAPSGNANGLAIDAVGRLLACEHGTRSVTRRELNGARTTLATSYKGGRLNSPNDLAVAHGAIWFTDPPYGIPRDSQELPFQGVFRIEQDGLLHLVREDFERPNGLAFSPDERTLYIADSSHRRHIRAFDVHRDGDVDGGGVFIDMDIATPGAPDGLAVAVNGRIFSTGPGGIWVIEPNGQILGILLLPESSTNCAFGDIDASEGEGHRVIRHALDRVEPPTSPLL